MAKLCTSTGLGTVSSTKQDITMNHSVIGPTIKHLLQVRQGSEHRGYSGEKESQDLPPLLMEHTF